MDEDQIKQINDNTLEDYIKYLVRLASAKCLAEAFIEDIHIETVEPRTGSQFAYSQVVVAYDMTKVTKDMSAREKQVMREASGTLVGLLHDAMYEVFKGTMERNGPCVLFRVLLKGVD